jgi:hypothetical protein
LRIRFTTEFTESTEKGKEWKIEVRGQRLAISDEPEALRCAQPQSLLRSMPFSVFSVCSVVNWFGKLCGEPVWTAYDERR